MKRLAWALVAVLVGCGENFPPEACGQTVTEIETYVGGVVVTSICFVDDSDEVLRYNVVASNTEVIDVTIKGDQLEIHGLDRGTSLVTIEAMDLEGDIGSYEITVAVVNRSPEVTESIPDQIMGQGDLVELFLNEYFEDPDGDRVIYTAVISPANIAGVYVYGNRVEVIGANVGTADMTVTVSDGDATATQEFAVRVDRVETSAIIDDDFEGDEISDWSPTNSGSQFRVSDGSLRIWSNGSDQGGVYLGFPDTKLWNIEARIRREYGKPTVAVFGIYGELSPYGFYTLFLDDDEFIFLINEFGSGGLEDSHFWNVPDTLTTRNEFIDVSIRYDALRGIIVSVSDVEIVNIEQIEDNPKPPRTIDDIIIIAYNRGRGGNVHPIEVDWVKVTGASATGRALSSGPEVVLPLEIRR